MKQREVSAPELRFLHHLAEQRDPENGIDIIVIPGLWARDCPVISSGECAWLKLLTASTNHDTRVFIFNYDVDPNTSLRSIWIAFLELAKVLMDAVRQVRPSQRQRRPLNFICHGLGGILLKEAVVLAARRYERQNPFRALSGIVFLGTPHLNDADDSRWDNWRDILLLYQRSTVKTATASQLDRDRLAQVCLNFALLDLPIPILSVFEAEETRMRDRNIFSKLKPMGKKLVDEDHARVRTSLEELIPASSGHHGLPVVQPNTALFQRLVTFFRNAPVKGRKTVEKAFEELNLGFLNTAYSDTAVESEMASQDAACKPTLPPGPGEVVFDAKDDDKQVLLPCHMLGNSRNRGFFGQHEHIQRISNALQPDVLTPNEEASSDSEQSDGTALSAFAICGMGGLGKTELATEYVHRHKGDFEAIFWINAATRQKLDSRFQAVAVQLGLLTEEAAFRQDPEVARDLVKEWLSHPVRVLNRPGHAAQPHDEIRWLLVFDNADDTDILADYWPLNGPGCVLITSRNPLSKQDAPSFAHLSGMDLPTMASADAGQWLRTLSRREQEPNSLEVCAVIADRLGGLPMAIVQMAGLIKKNHLSLVEFLESYDEDAKDFHDKPVAGLTKGQTLASTWNVESLSPPALALLRVLSVLDPDNIDEGILVTGAADTGLDHYPQTKQAYIKARKELMDSSLITRNLELGYLRIHRLVQDVVRNKLELDQLRAVFDAAVSLIAAVFPFFTEETEYKIERMRKVQTFLHHITAFQSLLKEKTAATLMPKFVLCSLCNEVAWFYCFFDWGFNLRYGCELAKLAEEILSVSSDGQDEKEISNLRTNSYRYQGITSIWMLDSQSAISNCQKWVEMLIQRIERYKDEVDINTLPVGYNELAIAHMTVPNEEEALRAFNTCIDLVEAKLEPGKPRFPYSYIHKSSLVAYRGDPDAAYSILAPVLAEREELLGVDNTKDLMDASAITFMGNIKRLQGKHDEALEFAKRAVNVSRISRGEHSSMTIHASYRLAREHFTRGEFEQAEALLRRCVVYPGVVPWLRPDLGRYSWKLGRTLQARGGDGAEAKMYLDRSQEIRRELAPGDERSVEELVDWDWDKLIYMPYR